MNRKKAEFRGLYLGVGLNRKEGRIAISNQIKYIYLSQVIKIENIIF